MVGDVVTRSGKVHAGGWCRRGRPGVSSRCAVAHNALQSAATCLAPLVTQWHASQQADSTLPRSTCRRFGRACQLDAFPAPRQHNSCPVTLALPSAAAPVGGAGPWHHGQHLRRHSAPAQADCAGLGLLLHPPRRRRPRPRPLAHLGVRARPLPGTHAGLVAVRVQVFPAQEQAGRLGCRGRAGAASGAAGGATDRSAPWHGPALSVALTGPSAFP